MITPKVWGFEEEIVNVEYCGKRMFVKEQYHSSIHKHAKKDEVLYVAGGLVWFEAGEDPAKLTGTWMRDGDRVRVKPGTWHRFTGMSDSLIFEFSTHHEDEDSTRHVGSGKADDGAFRALVAEFYKHDCGDRILTPGQAEVIAKALHAEGRVVGMVNGCFDLFHLGHADLLRKAKFRCEVLFAAVNSDASVVKLKGPKRPFVDEAGRAGMLAANRHVDYVVVSDGTTCLDVVDAIKPNVYVTTTEYGDRGPEAREVLKGGGKVEVVPMLAGYNSTKIANGILARK